MEKNNKKSSKGGIEVFMTKDFFNSLISILQYFIIADSENKYGVYAQKIKNKIMRYSRTFVSDGEENAVVYFYEDEAAILIKLFTIYFNATENSSADYFSQISRK